MTSLNGCRGRRRFRMLVVALIPGAALFSGLLRTEPAAAAEAANASADQLQEVVVTAEKREETITKVPISVSVLSRDDMMQRNIDTIADVAAVTPGVDFQNTGSTVALSIRGISSGI